MSEILCLCCIKVMVILVLVVVVVVVVMVVFSIRYKYSHVYVNGICTKEGLKNVLFNTYWDGVLILELQWPKDRLGPHYF